MKTIFKRMVAIFLVVSVVASVLSLNWSFYTVANIEGGEAFQYSKDFTKLNLSELDEVFTSAIITSTGGITVGKPSEQWSTSKNPNNTTESRFQNEYLKPIGNGNTYLLTFKDLQFKNFTASIEFLNSWREYGLYFGQSTTTDIGVTDTVTNGVAKVRMQENAGKIIAYGIDNFTPQWVGSKSYGEFYRYKDSSRTWTYNNQIISGFDSNVNSTNLHTLNIEVKDGVLKLWWSEYTDIVWTVNLNEKYNAGYVSLFSTGNQQGGIKSFTFTEIMEPSVDGSDCDFTNLSYVYQLNRDFDAYLVEKNQTIGTKEKASKLWTLSEDLPSYENGYKNPWLKPLHRNNGNNTLLTYNKSSYKDFQVSTEFVTNYVRYGVMVAPLGQIATPENGGVRVFVESNGIINIQGAVDGATARATGRKVKVTDKNAVSGYTISGFVGPSNSNNSISRTSYTLNVKIVDGVITVWLSEYADYIITAKLTEKYTGGYVSLYASAYDQGAFKNFKVSELVGSGTTDDGKTFNQSFNSITSLEELKNNFESYILNSAEESPVTAKMSDLFLLEKGRLKSNLSKNGTDSSGIAILTLKNKRYENFELKLSYEQDWLRYGVMFGTELGEYAFTSDGERLIGNGGVVAYTEAEGYTNAKGSIYASMYTNFSEALYRKNDITVESFSLSGTIEKTLKNKIIHTLTVRVVNGYMTMIVDGDEASRITLPLSNYDGGYISLITNAAKGREYGAFYGLTITELDKNAELEKNESPAVDGYDCDFTTLENVYQLNRDFYAYLVEKDSVDGKKGVPADYWTLATNLKNYEKVYANPWLKPMHRNNGKNTLLTYNKSSLENLQVSTEFVTNHVRYGVMVAPLGQIATDENGGVRVFVESNGIINIQGAVDGATVKATGGQVKVLDKNSVSGYPIDGFIAPSNESNEISRTSYTLNVKIVDGVITVWLSEYADYIITAKLTEKYTGGYVSLYASAYDQGAFKNFKVSELVGSGTTDDGKTFNQSFNSITSLEELKNNFESYILNSAEESPVTAKMSDLFLLEKGRLKSNLSKNGTDSSGIAILTLKNKRYENFELKLSYEQDWLRYGVMFGTELGEYAFTLDGERLIGNGGVVAYTEAEGYTNAKGSMYASCYTNASQALCRKNITIVKSFNSFENVEKTLQKKPVHTFTVRVVNGYMTMIVDNDETTRITIRLADYDGGYISLITTAGVGRNEGAFYGLTVTELANNAQLNADIPNTTKDFETISQVASEFDAYYLADAEKSTKLEKVDIKDRWWINKGGNLSRLNGASGIKETSDVEILTYKKQQFKDFELTYTYQQTYQRIGIMIGGDLKNYPIYFKDGKLAADKGALFFVEAEGYPNVKGHLNNYTSTNYLIYRTTNPTAPGFVDVNGSPMENVNNKKEHTVKIVVKDNKLYAYIDGGETPYLYVKLGDNYNGGYVSIFSVASSDYGISRFEISDRITTKLPQSGGTVEEENTFTANFNSVLFDDSRFTTYYLDALKNNTDGTLTKYDFDDRWTIADGTLKRTNILEDGSDASRVSVLTYNKKLTNFVVSYKYQKWDKRLMFMFGTENGKYTLANAGEGDYENGGVLMYPENDLGAGGGIIAIGGVSPLTSSYRPVSRKEIALDGYHVINEALTKDQNWKYNFGSWHTMTVTVINKHCYIYLDDYGLIADYGLKDDYDGGYISFAAAGSQYGFDDISITDLSAISENSIVSVENPRDITVKLGTDKTKLGLPSTVKATLKNGKTVNLPVEWKELNYNKDKEGNYSFTALLPEKADILNPAMVSVVINVRAKESIPVQKSDTKEWTFETSDDLLDFKSTYLIDGEQGYTENNTARWYCDGRLLRDAFRTINGSEKRDISLLTYVGATYHNFELEVDYTQHYTRMGVLFGSDKPCQYINLADIHGENNPVMAFVEYEGVRNFIGNVKNTNFYTRIDETIYNARENGACLSNYYTEANANTGDVHKMKLRVVGDQASIWIDDCKTPFTATLTNYDGGYISLISATKGGWFDNLKITRLDGDGNVVVKDPDVDANGKMDLEIDKSASTDLVEPTVTAPEKYSEDVIGETKKLSAFNIVIGSMVFAVAIILSAGMIIVAVINKKRNKQER